MAYIADGSIKEVIARTDVVQIVGEYVSLKKAGIRFKGLCPFHSEKTPSFTVNQEQGFFHCFGCGEHGDSIGFLMKHNGVTFVEAVEQLASRAGIPLTYEGNKEDGPRRTPEERDTERRILQAQMDLTSWTARWFQGRLSATPRTAPIWEYIEERGLQAETLKTFWVGFAPDDWAELSQAIQSDGRDSKLAEDLGLILPRKSGQGTYDRFRNRLIFPVFDIAERPIGFGGRVLPGKDEKETAKYINSPDSPIYTKGDILFGLAQAKRAIRTEGYAIVVEGNIDVLTLHQEGFPTTVAPMGTALTPHQVRLLKRFTEEVVLLYDGDKAGRAAAIKSLPLLLDVDLHGRVALLADGEDPDTFVRTQGKEALEHLIKNAPPLMEFLIDEIVERHGSSDRGRARSLAELQPFYQGIQDFRERQLVLARISDALNLPERRVVGMLRAGSKREAVEPETKSFQIAQITPPSIREERLTIACLQYPSCLSRLEDVDGQALVEHDGLRQVLWEAITTYGEGGSLDPNVLLERIEDPALRNWASGAFCAVCEVTEEEGPKFVDSCLELMRVEAKKSASSALTREIAVAQREGNPEKIQDLVERKLELDRERTGVGSSRVLSPKED